MIKRSSQAYTRSRLGNQNLEEQSSPFFPSQPMGDNVLNMTWQTTGHDTQKARFGVMSSWWHICWNLILFSYTQKAYGNTCERQKHYYWDNFKCILIYILKSFPNSALQLTLVTNDYQHILQFRNSSGRVTAMGTAYPEDMTVTCWV